MKKILVLYGSHRAQSVSTALCNELLKGADTDNEYEIIRYNAFNMKAEPCFGCGWCEKNKGCVLRDLDGFMQDFEQADYFVVATPVYNGGVPAPLKAVVDRFQRYYALHFSHGIRPAVEKPKKAALVITAGSKGEGREHIESMFRQQFTVLNTQLVQTLFVDSTDIKQAGNEEYRIAYECGRKLFE